MSNPNTSTTTKLEVFQYKVVLLGESGVGKSNLVLQFVRGQFIEGKESTIGAAFLSHNMELEDRLVKFEIWDTAGQERYHSLAPMYYRGSQAAVVVYDITDENSYEKAENWIRELQRQAPPGILMALAGNKSDLEHRRTVQTKVAEAFARENQLIFFETSAKTAQNVTLLFKTLADKLPRVQKPPPKPVDPVIPIRPIIDKKDSKECPC